MRACHEWSLRCFWDNGAARCEFAANVRDGNLPRCDRCLYGKRGRHTGGLAHGHARGLDTERRMSQLITA